MSRSLSSDDGDARPRRLVPIAVAAALVLAIAAVALSVAVLFRPAAAGCQVAAWNSVPRASEMPTGWTMGATNIYGDSQTTTISGPDPGDGSGPRIYLSVTCFTERAQDVVDRMEQSSKGSGRAVTALDGIGEAGYALAADATSGSALHFRRGSLVAYLLTAGSIADADLRQAGSAVDAALRRALGDAAAAAAPLASSAASPVASPEGSPASSPAASGGVSPEPSEAAPSPVAAELEALMPRTVSGTSLLVQSATGDQVLGADAASKALTSAITTFGKKPIDLQIAQAADATGALALSVLGFRVKGVTSATLKPVVLQSWVFGGAAGVTTKEKQVGGVAVTEVNYSGDTSVTYVTIRKDAVLVIQASNAAIADAAVGALP